MSTPINIFNAITVLCFSLLLTGCSAQTTYTETLTAAQQTDPTAPVLLDISLFRGSVTIYEDPTLTQIHIQRTFHARRNELEHFQDNVKLDPPLNDSLSFINYQATYTPRHRTMRRPAWIITADTSYPMPQYQWVNLEIYAPNLAGVLLQTSHGNVTIHDAPAPLHVVNDQGDITITTTRPITSDIQLITAHGDIKLTIPQASTGSANLDAGSGTATILNYLNQKSAQQEKSHAFCNLNPGRNSIILQTTQGDAKLQLTVPDEKD